MTMRGTALAATTALAAALAGCSGAAAGPAAVAPATPAPAAHTSVAQAAAALVWTPPAPFTGNAAFVGSVTLPSGLKITVSQPTAVPASTQLYSSYGAVEGKIVYFNVSITNLSNSAVNPTMASAPAVTYGDTGLMANMAGDSLDWNVPIYSIQPGETHTDKLGYGVPSSGFGHLRVEITMPIGSFKAGDVDHAIFTGPVR